MQAQNQATYNSLSAPPPQTDPQQYVDQGRAAQRYGISDPTTVGPNTLGYMNQADQRAAALQQSQQQVDSIQPRETTRINQPGTSQAQRDAYAQNPRFLSEGVAGTLGLPRQRSYDGINRRVENPDGSVSEVPSGPVTYSVQGYGRNRRYVADDPALANERQDQIRANLQAKRDPGYADRLPAARKALEDRQKARSQMRRDRQQARRDGTDSRWSQIQEREKFKGDARRARMERRQSGPSPLEAAFMAGGPQAVFNYMNTQQMMGPQMDNLAADTELKRAQAQMQGMWAGQMGGAKPGAEAPDLGRAIGIPPGSNPMDILPRRYPGGIPEGDHENLQAWAQSAPLRPGNSVAAQRHNDLVMALQSGNWEAAEGLLAGAQPTRPTGGFRRRPADEIRAEGLRGARPESIAPTPAPTAAPPPVGYPQPLPPVPTTSDGVFRRRPSRGYR